MANQPSQQAKERKHGARAHEATARTKATIPARRRAKPGIGGFRGVVPPGQHCGAQAKVLTEDQAAFAAAWGYVDLNHGPRPYQGRALTD
jgi:ribosomal protein L34